MTGQGPIGTVEAAVEGYYGKRIGTLRMLAAGIPEGLVEMLEPRLGRLEAELHTWRAGKRLPDGTVLDLYLDTFDPDHPEDDLRRLPDAAAEDERRTRLLLRRELEALGYGLEPDPHAPPAVAPPCWPTRPALSIGDTRSSDLRRAERYVLEQYRVAIRAALTAAQLEPIHEEQKSLYFPFASRAPGPLGNGLPLTTEIPSAQWQLEHGVELNWSENRWLNKWRGWSYGPLDSLSEASWEHEPLLLPLFADPGDIVDVVRELLEGNHDIAPRTREWEHAGALTVLWGQVEALERANLEKRDMYP
ncbi:hypothetical protein ACWEO1_27535 [Kitasatospora cineracea]